VILTHKAVMYNVLLHEVIDLLPMRYKILLISRISWLSDEWIKKSKNNKPFLLPFTYAICNVITGAANTEMTLEELDRITDNRELRAQYFNKFVYDDSNYHFLLYDPYCLSLANPPIFDMFGVQKGYDTDCLLHAFNYLVGCPYFTCRA